MTTDTTNKTRTLYERITDVQGKVGDLKPTGKNQFAAKALSIGDIEGALRVLTAEAGIVTRWGYLSDESGALRLHKIDAQNWMAELRVTVCSADDKEDHFEDEWADIGGNPMAATSFARKGYLKALFHITEEGDEKGTTPATPAAAQHNGQPAASDAPPARSRGPERQPIVDDRTNQPRPCPDCGEGTLELLTWPGGAQRIACSNWRTCKYRENVPTAAETHDAPAPTDEDTPALPLS